MTQGAIKQCSLVSLLFLILTLSVGRLAVNRDYSLDTNYCQYVQGVLFTRGVIHGGAEHFQSLSVHLNCMINPLRKGYASKYPPGYSGLIAAGLLLGVDSLINPLCGALTVLLMLMLVREHYGDKSTLFWASILSLVSTYFVFMSAEFWNHPSALLACMLIVWAAFTTTDLLEGVKRARKTEEYPLRYSEGFFVKFDARSVRTASTAAEHSFETRPSAVWPWIRGLVIILALTYCALTRPLSSLAMIFFVGCVVAYRLTRKPATKSEALLLLASTMCGTLTGAASFGFYNYLLTGDPWLSGYEALHGPSHNPGFHVDPYGRNFTMWEGLKDLMARWLSMNEWLFMWPIPSLSLLAIWFVSFKKWRAFDAACVLWLALQSLMYCFMWSAGQVPVGPRFLYEALPAILILSARGMVIVEGALGAGKWARIGLVACVTWLSVCGFYRYVQWASS